MRCAKNRHFRFRVPGFRISVPAILQIKGIFQTLQTTIVKHEILKRKTLQNHENLH